MIFAAIEGSRGIISGGTGSITSLPVPTGSANFFDLLVIIMTPILLFTLAIALRRMLKDKLNRNYAVFLGMIAMEWLLASIVLNIIYGSLLYRNAGLYLFELFGGGFLTSFLNIIAYGALYQIMLSSIVTAKRKIEEHSGAKTFHLMDMLILSSRDRTDLSRAVRDDIAHQLSANSKLKKEHQYYLKRAMTIYNEDLSTSMSTRSGRIEMERYTMQNDEISHPMSYVSAIYNIMRQQFRPSRPGRR